MLALGASFHSIAVNKLNRRQLAVAKFTMVRPPIKLGQNSALCGKADNSADEKQPSVFDQVASKGLAGILAITAAEAIFWALGLPLAELYIRFTTGEWIDLATTEGKVQASAFSFGYGGFATLILQYRVTIFAIPLVPIMEKYVVQPGKQLFGEQFGEKKSE